jgi:predicted component of type VI protein secretion system
MSAVPSLTLTIRGASATRMIVVDGPSVTIGRGADCTIVLADTRRAISRLHASIEWRDGHYVLTDSGSNPTLINGHILKVSREAVLRDADALSIGEYLIELGIDGPSTSDDATIVAMLRGVSRGMQAANTSLATTWHGSNDGSSAGHRGSAAAEPSGKAFDNLTMVRLPSRKRGALPESVTVAASAEPDRIANLFRSEHDSSPAHGLTATVADRRDDTVKRSAAP